MNCHFGREWRGIEIAMEYRRFCTLAQWLSNMEIWNTLSHFTHTENGGSSGQGDKLHVRVSNFL